MSNQFATLNSEGNLIWSNGFTTNVGGLCIRTKDQYYARQKKTREAEKLVEEAQEKNEKEQLEAKKLLEEAEEKKETEQLEAEKLLEEAQEKKEKE